MLVYLLTAGAAERLKATAASMNMLASHLRKLDQSGPRPLSDARKAFCLCGFACNPTMQFLESQAQVPSAGLEMMELLNMATLLGRTGKMFGNPFGKRSPKLVTLPQSS